MAHTYRNERSDDANRKAMREAHSVHDASLSPFYKGARKLTKRDFNDLIEDAINPNHDGGNGNV